MGDPARADTGSGNAGKRIPVAAAIVGFAFFAVAGIDRTGGRPAPPGRCPRARRGTLNIAIEGARLTMELEAPGADIVGFEHKAKTEQQKAAVEKAKQQLAEPQALFKLPAAAGCVLKEAKRRRSKARTTTTPCMQGRQGQGRPSTTTARPTMPSASIRVSAPSTLFECKSPGEPHRHRLRLLQGLRRRAEARREGHHPQGAEQVRGEPRQAPHRSRRHDVGPAMDGATARPARAAADDIVRMSRRRASPGPAREAFSLAVRRASPCRRASASC